MKAEIKKTVYLDSTIISYYFDKRTQIKTYCDITRKWWKQEQKKYLIFISNEVFAELESGNYPAKNKLINFAKNLKVLKYNNNIFNIASVYIDNYLMPQHYAGDAIHLAYASYYKMDFLLTWNCNHLANANKRNHIRIINTKLNIFTPEITTPLELFSEEAINGN